MQLMPPFGANSAYRELSRQTTRQHDSHFFPNRFVLRRRDWTETDSIMFHGGRVSLLQLLMYYIVKTYIDVLYS